MEEMAFSSFAVLYPKDAYGTLSRDLLENKVLDMGGEFVSAVPYEDGETDFQDEIRLLVARSSFGRSRGGKMKGSRRGSSKRGLHVALEEEGTAAGIEAGFGIGEEESEEERSCLRSRVLFIPDHFRRVALIAPHLALYDVNEITLMGTNAWNSNLSPGGVGRGIRAERHFR